MMFPPDLPSSPPAMRKRNDAWVEDVAVPAGQAALLAAPVAVGAFMVTVAVWGGDLLARLGPAFAVGVIAACMVFGGWALRSITKRQALWALERALNRDLDGDGHKGAPEPSESDKSLVVEIHDMSSDGEPTKLRYLHCGVPPVRMKEVAQMVLSGFSLTHSDVTGKGRPLVRAELETLQEELVAQGLARWRSEKSRSQGMDLTAAGRAVFKRIAESV